MNSVVAMVGLDERDAAVVAVLAHIVRKRDPAGAPARVALVHAVDATPADRGALEARVAAVGAALGVPVRVHVGVGPADEVAASVLVEEAGELLVIGRSASDGDAAWGGHGRRLLRHVGCPVLLVPEDAAARAFQRAVVGMDLSAASFDALALARVLCAHVEAVAVLAPEDAAAGAAGLGDSVRARFAAALAERGLPDVPLRTVEGAPADALLAAAQDVDLVAVGSRGLSPLATVFLGSTAERLAGRSPRPVLVVRRRVEARGLLGALFGS